MQKIRKKADLLPFKPTENPTQQETLLATQTVITLVQNLIHNPAATLAILKAAQKVYQENLKEKGFTDEAALKGVDDMATIISTTMLSMSREKASKKESLVVEPDRRLVDLDGSPLTAS